MNPPDAPDDNAGKTDVHSPFGGRSLSARLAALRFEAVEVDRALAINGVLRQRAQRNLAAAASASEFALSAAELAGELARRSAAIATARGRCEALVQQLDQLVSRMPAGRMAECNGILVKALVRNEAALLALAALEPEQPSRWLGLFRPGALTTWKAKVTSCAAECAHSALALGEAQRAAVLQQEREVQERVLQLQLVDARSRADVATDVALAIGVDRHVSVQAYATWAEQAEDSCARRQREYGESLQRLVARNQEGAQLQVNRSRVDTDIAALTKMLGPHGPGTEDRS